MNKTYEKGDLGGETVGTGLRFASASLACQNGFKSF